MKRTIKLCLKQIRARRPTLSLNSMVYGNLNHITQMLGNLGVLDGPKMKIDKTNA